MSEKPTTVPGIAGMWAADLTNMQEQERKPLSRTPIEKVYSQKPVQKPEAKPAPERASAPSTLDEALEALEKTVAPVNKRSPGEKDGETISYIHPAFIEVWEYHNRPESEIQSLDLDEMTESIRSFGQEVPGLVRPHPDPSKPSMYQLIYGRKRWTICRDLGVKFKCRVMELSDEDAAIKMELENNDRDPPSSWGKCQAYMKMLENKVFTNQAALAAKLGIDRATMSNLMIYSRIPKQIADAIGPMSNVSILTAKAIVAAVKEEGDSAIDSIVSFADKIRSGSLTNKTLVKELQKSKQEGQSKSLVVGKKTGRKIGSYRNTGRGSTQITFTKEFVDQFGGFEKVVQVLSEALDK